MVAPRCGLLGRLGLMGQRRRGQEQDLDRANPAMGRRGPAQLGKPGPRQGQRIGPGAISWPCANSWPQVPAPPAFEKDIMKDAFGKGWAKGYHEGAASGFRDGYRTGHEDGYETPKPWVPVDGEDEEGDGQSQSKPNKIIIKATANNGQSGAKSTPRWRTREGSITKSAWDPKLSRHTHKKFSSSCSQWRLMCWKEGSPATWNTT